MRRDGAPTALRRASMWRPAAGSDPARPLGPVAVVVAVVAVGLVVSGALAWAAWTSNRHNEDRLLHVQGKQAAAVLAGTILGLSAPLDTVLEVTVATAGDVAAFRAAAAPLVDGEGRPFESVLLLRAPGPSTADAVETVDRVGSPPLLTASATDLQGLVGRAQRTEAFAVGPVGRDRIERVGYAMADLRSGLVVYAERAIPPDRLVPAVRSPAFANLEFATYIGPAVETAALATTNVPLSSLPLTGRTTREVVPFGDTVLTIVARATQPLGGPLGERLPGVLLVAGLLLSGATALAAERSARQRVGAERDAATIGALYREVDALYGEQRSIAQALQQALLPRRHPVLPGIEVASRYVAGARGVEVGGDWYTVVALDPGRFAFVIGDVSGRGVDAATVMARIRFTLRAYLLEGHPPDRVLDMTAEQLDLLDDGHFATALVGVADVGTAQVRLANAGHLEPLVVHAGTARPVATRVGPPLGVDVGPHPVTTVVVPTGGTLLLFTDGLVERRTEDLDDGLHRLAAAAAAAHGAPAAALVDAVVGALVPEAAEDDVAVLAIRWAATGPGGEDGC